MEKQVQNTQRPFKRKWTGQIDKSGAFHSVYIMGYVNKRHGNA